MKASVIAVSRSATHSMSKKNHASIRLEVGLGVAEDAVEQGRDASEGARGGARAIVKAAYAKTRRSS